MFALVKRWRRDFADHPQEVELLEKQIVERLGRDFDEPTARRHAEFVEAELVHHLRNYRTFAVPYGLAFGASRLISTVAGLATTIIAGFAVHPGWARGVIAGLGALTVIAGAINQMWKPGSKAYSRYEGAAMLWREAWSYAQGLAKYQGGTADEAWRLFAEEILQVVRATAEADIASFRAIAHGEELS